MQPDRQLPGRTTRTLEPRPRARGRRGVARAHSAVAIAVALATALALAGCGSGSGNRGDGAEQNAGDIRVAVVTDIGGLNDRGFNALANEGLQAAKRELGIEGRVLISKSAADYVPNLAIAARRGFDLVIANGFLMGDAVATASRRFPDVAFAIVDFPFEGLDGAPSNARGLVFAEEEAGYLVGIAASTAAKGDPVGFVGGQTVPAVVAFLAGYRKGVQDGGGGRVLSAYSQDFVDAAKCKELALEQIQRGAQAIFAAAGGCGLGALQAAEERDVWGIGVDSDQSFLGRHILTSATKRVDVAVLETIRDVVEGDFEGGGNATFTVLNGGVGYGTLSPDAPDGVRQAMEDAMGRITTGEVRIPRG